MPPRTIHADDKIRVMRVFPSEENAQTRRRLDQDDSRSDPLTDLQSTALTSIWSRVIKGSEASDALTDINVAVFENVKEFCRQAHVQRSDRLPIGALFTGSLVQCHEVEPLKLLGEVLSEASFHVARIDPLDITSITDVIDTCLVQLTNERGMATEIDALSLWFARHATSPLVMLIPSVETLDSRVLADLVSLLSRRRMELPVTLLVGLSTTTRVDPLVPSHLRSRLQSQPFALMSPRQCFEKILEKMLLSPSCPGIVVGRCVMEMLNNLYLYHHFTIKAFKDHLKQALLEHVSRSPLGALLQFMDATVMHKESLLASLNEMPDEFWNAASPMRIHSLPDVMRDALERVTGWKTTLLWLHQVAEMVGSVTRGAGFSLRELYRNALYSDFIKSQTIPEVYPTPLPTSPWSTRVGGGVGNA